MQHRVLEQPSDNVVAVECVQSRNVRCRVCERLGTIRKLVVVHDCHQLDAVLDGALLMCHHHQRECVLVQNDIKLCTPYVAAYNLLERGCGSSTAVVLAIQCCYHQERCRKRINVRLQYLHNRLASQKKKKNAARSSGCSALIRGIDTSRHGPWPRYRSRHCRAHECRCCCGPCVGHNTVPVDSAASHDVRTVPVTREHICQHRYLEYGLYDARDLLRVLNQPSTGNFANAQTRSWIRCSDE